LLLLYRTNHKSVTPEIFIVTRIPVKKVHVGDVTLAYSELGCGYPVVLINGFASTMDMWNPPVLESIAESFRVIIFDNRGTGFSSNPDKEFSIPLLAADAAGLMDALGIPSAHILGFSMGASIAQELVLTVPEKISRLVLVAGECGGSEAVMMQPEIQSRLMDKSGSDEDVARRMFSLIFPPDWLRHHDPLQYCPEICETTCEETVSRQAAARFSWKGSHSRLPGIRSQTLVITGTDDCIVPSVNSHLIREGIPGAELVEIQGAGHGLMYQFPHEFSSAVLEFLRR
jgi:pimeloyl-ACP methyl ester carboxylesterase